MLQNALNHIVNLVLPPRCPATGAVVERQGLLAPQAWADLRLIGEPNCAVCGYPFEFETESGALCAPCLRDRPPYASARAALAYDDASRALILRFKHGDQTHQAQALAGLMERAGADMLRAADIIAPVPLHWTRLLKRRYNQSSLLARTLSRSAKKLCLPDLLCRSRATPSQGHKGFKERYRNVSRAFTLHQRHEGTVTGKKIVLVDDVYTSGATVRECAEILMKSGAASVHVLTLARVVRAEIPE